MTETSLLNFVVSDGCAAVVSSRSLAGSCPDRHSTHAGDRLTMLATRFVAGAKDEAPASMYYAEGSAFQRSAPAHAAEGTAAAGAEAYDGQGFDGKQEPCSPTKNAASARHTSVTGEARTPCASTLFYQAGACCARAELPGLRPSASRVPANYVVLRGGRAGRVHPDVRGGRDPRGADRVRADHGFGERLGGSAAQHRPDRVPRQRRLLEPAQQPARRTWHAGAPTGAGPAPGLCAAARPWGTHLRRPASRVLCVCCRRAARRLRAAWRLPWARPRLLAARGTSSTPAESQVGPHQAALTAHVLGRAGAQGSPCQCVTCLARCAGAGAAREGRAGRGQLQGGAGRADSTPGALWLDGAAKVVAGEEQRLAGHHGPVLCLALSGDRLFSSSTDLTIKVHP